MSTDKFVQRGRNETIAGEHNERLSHGRFHASRHHRNFVEQSEIAVCARVS